MVINRVTNVGDFMFLSLRDIGQVGTTAANNNETQALVPGRGNGSGKKTTD